MNMEMHATCLIGDFGTMVSYSVVEKVADVVVMVAVGSSWH